ncbi:GNAT family N-acetyltransferase [Pseudarthrobacter sp. J1738]|uniref:GNAT family N-acetyltransferase n=1 Tax=Pseudarthrobacter sp. J1738 TaxID=3420446 RepID=UPI003D2A24E9
MQNAEAIVWLVPLKDLSADALAIKLGDIAELAVEPDQNDFVRDALKMSLIGLEVISRFPFAIEANGEVVGVLTLQYGAATLAGWPDDESVWLLRGLLIDKRFQGQGLGTKAAEAAVLAARRLNVRHQSKQSGVVLSVNERNVPGLRAYRKAGYGDHGQYLGGASGPQRTMFRSFDAEPH